MDLRNKLPGNTFQYIVTTDGTHLFDGTGSLMTSLTITSLTSSQVTQSFVSESFVSVDNLQVTNLTASKVKFGFTVSDPTGPSGDIALFATQSTLVITSSISQNAVVFGNGICFADFGFQTSGIGGEGFFDNSQTPGRVPVWNPSFPALSSSLVSIAELQTLVGASSSIQSQIDTLKNHGTASYVSSSGNVVIQSGFNTIDFKNSSSAQTVNIYGAATTSASFNRLAFYQGVNGMVIESQPQGAASSSGDLTISHAANHSIKFNTSGSLRWTIASQGDFLPGASTYNIGQVGQGVNNFWVTNIIGSSITGSLNGNADTATSASFASQSISSSLANTLAPYQTYTTITTGSNIINIDYTGGEQYVSITTGALYNFTCSNLPVAGKTANVSLYIDNSVAVATSSLRFPSDWIFIGGTPLSITASKNAVLSLKAFGNKTVAAYGFQQ